MPKSGTAGNEIALTRSDAWLLAALTEGSHDGRPVTLRDLIHDADWLNRDIPSFDEISYGIPRLIAAGFAKVGYSASNGLVFRATAKAQRLRRSVRGEWDSIVAISTAIGAKPHPEEEAEDRSLGRLPGLEPEDVTAAVAEHASWVERVSQPYIDAAQAMIRDMKRESDSSRRRRVIKKPS
jgi:hypothetical protein